MVFLASASTLPGLVVRTESGGDGSPNSCCLSATAFGHRCSQCSTVCGFSPQLGVDCRVDLVVVSLKEGGVTGS